MSAVYTPDLDRVVRQPDNTKWLPSEGSSSKKHAVDDELP